MSYSDDENGYVEDFSEEEIYDDDDEAVKDYDEQKKNNLFDVNSVSKTPGFSADRFEDVDLVDDSVVADSENEFELHGKGERMKLSTKTPDVLLRQYQHKISTCIQESKVKSF